MTIVSEKKWAYLLIVIFSILVSQVSQAQFDQKKEIEKKKLHYQSMIKKGNVLKSIGGITLVGGTILTVSGKWYCSYGSCSAEDPKAAIGTLFILTGIGIGTAGIIYKSTGQRKVRQYERILENLSVRISPESEYTRFYLVYKF